jgi:sulfate/thiosulfate transport system permease protein
MSSAATGTSSAAPPRPAYRPRLGGAALGRGLVTAYLSIIVLLPIAALVAQSSDGGWSAFWNAISTPEAWWSLRWTLIASLIVVVINVFAGTMIAWVLVRDNFRGKAALNGVIDLPFALPTIVAGITLLALYGPESPVGIDAAYTKIAVIMALAFVTLPFVVRAVQPVLMEVDREAEEAAASLGASRFTTFRRIILPSLMPAILAGSALAFARAIGEFGSLVLFAGFIAFKTEVMSGLIYQQIGSGNLTGAAAQSVMLLAIALVVLLIFGRLTKWSLRHAG